MSIAGSEAPLTEMLFGLVSGVAFGLTSPIVGHPFDAVKTNMQVKQEYHNKSMLYVAKDMLKEGGFRSFYRGFLPPLLGSAAFRGVQFSAYSGGFSWAERQPLLSSAIPMTGGLHLSVVFGAVTGALARSAIESPLDYMKVRRMTNQSYLLLTTIPAPTTFATLLPHLTTRQFIHLYSGFVPTFLRTSLLFTAFFSLVDTSVRHIPAVINAPGYGPFFKVRALLPFATPCSVVTSRVVNSPSFALCACYAHHHAHYHARHHARSSSQGGVCATAAWGFAFPMETAKSVVQGDARFSGMSTLRVVRTIVSEGGGFSALYRGFSAGASRSFVANGASMLVYSSMQSELRKET